MTAPRCPDAVRDGWCDDRPVVVVGGGIGGTVAALALHRIGLQVCVLEKATTASDGGSGITLSTNAMAALDAIGVGDAVRAVGTVPPAGSAGVRRPDGRLLLDMSAVSSVGDLYVFHRRELLTALRGLLPTGVLRTGDVSSVGTNRNGSVVVECADGDRFETGLVVAADGLRSRIRSGLHADRSEPRYAGYTSWRAVTTGPVDVVGVVGETWGMGERFGVVPLRDGRVYWFAVANQPVGTRVDAYGEVSRRFGGWHAPIPALLAATDPAGVLSLDICDLATPLAPFATGRVALLGDAAHAMTPDVGQGAGQAVEDAVVLAAALAEHSDLQSALARYDRERRPRVEGIVKAARRTGRLAQVDSRLGVCLRTLALRLVPPTITNRLASRVANWSPPSVPDRL